MLSKLNAYRNSRRFYFWIAFALLLLLEPATAEIVVDNNDGAPSYIESPDIYWVTPADTGYQGTTYRKVPYRWNIEPISSATWTPNFPDRDLYEIYAVIRALEYGTQNAPYTIHHASGTTLVQVSQRGADDVREIYLGEFYFNSGTEGYVKIENTGCLGSYIADAILFRNATDKQPMFPQLPPYVIPSIPLQTDQVSVIAEISDDRGEIDSATVAFEISPGGESGIVPAYDDGNHNDEGPNDSIFGAQILAYPAGSQVSYSFTALDNAGHYAVSATRTYEVAFPPVMQSDSYIVAGQSNASGRGRLDSGNETPDPQVFMFANDYVWKMAYEPVDDRDFQLDCVSEDYVDPTASRGHGFALRAGKTIVDSSPVEVRIIPCALGASAISQWRRPLNVFDRQTLFGSMNYRASLAAPLGVKAIWWFQGESECYAPELLSGFIVNNSLLMNEFREELGSELDIVYIQLAQTTDVGMSSYKHEVSEYQRQMESGSGDDAELDRHYMVVSFDLPLNDRAHLSQEGQKMLGERVGLATLEHVYGVKVDGTGPRLLQGYPAIHPEGDRSKVKVQFNCMINSSVDNYDNQFRIFDGTSECSILDAIRDPEDEDAVLIQLSQVPKTTVSVSYGDVLAAGLHLLLENVVKSEAGLPAPRFGPIDVVMDSQIDTPTATATQTSTATEMPTIPPSATFTPTATDTLEPTQTATGTPSLTATQSPTASNTSTPTASNTPSLTPTNTATASPTSSPTPSNTSTPTLSNSPTFTPTPSNTPTYTWSFTPTHTPTHTSTQTWTFTPTPRNTPTPTPTEDATPPPVPFYDGTIGTIATGVTISGANGDDKYYGRGLPRRFTDNGDGTVTDENTKMMWIKDPSHAGIGEIYTWNGALDAPESFSYAGYDDWQLPTVEQLSILRNAGEADPKIDSEFICESAKYWVSSEYDGTNAFAVNFENGELGKSEKSNKHYIRLIRNIVSATTSGRFVDLGKTILDKNTNLMWVKNPPKAGLSEEYFWSDAINECEELEYDNHDDWRMPNVNELQSLLDYTQKNPAINPIFETDSDFYWTSSYFVGLEYNYTFCVNFKDPGVAKTTIATSHNMIQLVLPVRGGVDTQ